jgi:hypothetical protein
MLVLVGGFGVFKYVTLYRENQKLRTENELMARELHNIKFIPRELKF